MQWLRIMGATTTAILVVLAHGCSREVTTKQAAASGQATSKPTSRRACAAVQEWMGVGFDSNREFSKVLADLPGMSVEEARKALGVVRITERVSEAMDSIEEAMEISQSPLFPESYSVFALIAKPKVGTLVLAVQEEKIVSAEFREEEQREHLIPKKFLE